MRTTTAPRAARHLAAVLRWWVTVPAVTLTILAAALTGTADRMDFVTDPSGAYAADLAHDRGCWTQGEPAPADVIPGHAVIVTPDGTPRYVGGAAASHALDQAFGKAPVTAEGSRPYAFCR